MKNFEMGESKRHRKHIENIVFECEIGRVSESRQAKRKRSKHKHVSRKLRDTVVSEGEIGGVSEHCQAKRKRSKHEHVSKQEEAKRKRAKKKHVFSNPIVESGIHASKEEMSVYPAKSIISETCQRIRKIFKVSCAKKALKFYRKSQGAEFELVEALDSNCMDLCFSGSNLYDRCCHVVFTARPKKTDSIDVSPKYFFAELVRKFGGNRLHVTYCSIFEPSDAPGLDHGCIICPPVLKAHPANGYYRGHYLSSRKPKFAWI